MNERIRLLAEQAGFIDFIVFNRIESKEQVIEKFAQLIVQECCSVVKPSTKYPTESVDIVEEFHRGYWVGCNDSTYRIKDHFGVEE